MKGTQKIHSQNGVEIDQTPDLAEGLRHPARSDPSEAWPAIGKGAASEMKLHRTHGPAQIAERGLRRAAPETSALQQTPQRQQQKVTAAKEGLQQAQTMRGAIGDVAAEIEDGRRDLGPGEHRQALNFSFGGERFQRGGDVRGAEGGAQGVEEGGPVARVAGGERSGKRGRDRQALRCE
jgi:hypothetical protein